MEDLLKNMQSIAVIGASPARTRASNSIVRYLIQNGFKVIPVNPNYDSVEGIRCYAAIGEIPLDTRVDVFTIFRNARYSADTVRDIVEWAEESGQSPAVWTQLGVSTPEAEKVARDARLKYVRNRCIMVEHSVL